MLELSAASVYVSLFVCSLKENLNRLELCLFGFSDIFRRHLKTYYFQSLESLIIQSFFLVPEVHLQPTVVYVYQIYLFACLQCFDTVGWAAGRASGLCDGGAGVVICLERGADLHTTQLMTLPLTVSCFSKVQICFTFLVPAHPCSLVKGPLNGVCVCVAWLCVCR